MIKDTYSGHYGRLVEVGNTFAYFISELNSNTLDVQLCHVKPYLRPMSSMTEEEAFEFGDAILNAEPEDLAVNKIDWLNAHHFDYRGLIEKGLALEAPSGRWHETARMRLSKQSASIGMSGRLSRRTGHNIISK